MDETPHYYYLDAQRVAQGPFSLDSLLQKLASGELSGDVLVARDGGDKWAPLRALSPQGRCAAVGPCPKCGAELHLQEGELPLACPSCGVRLRLPGSGPLHAVRAGLAKYVDFRGRATRAEFFWFALFLFLASHVLGLARLPLAAVSLQAVIIFLWVKFVVFCIGWLSVGARRLHDVGLSGWWLALWVILWQFLGLSVQWLAEHVRASASAPGETGMLAYMALNLVLLGVGLFLLSAFVSDSRRGTNKYGPSAKYPLG